MQVGFSEDQIQFRDVVNRFLATKSPPTAVRAMMESEAGYDRQVWKQLCEEVGLAGTHLPEAYGGFGFGPVELGIAMQEMGRFLYCGPFFASAVMAGYAILNAGTEAAKQDLLPAIADGTRIATLVLDDFSHPAAVGRSIVASETSETSETNLNGTASMVLDAQVADTLIVAAGSQAGVSLYQVNNAATAKVRPLQVIDATRKLAAVTFKDVPAKLISRPGGAELDLLWDQMCVALAHEMIGGTEALFESTIEYMQMRVQFGRAIASFQALKHRCADLLLELELAKANTHAAARYLATGEGDAYAPSMAKAAASDAYISIAKAAIQLRGGIGFTWEEDTHLWFKRAKSSEVFLGTPNMHRERMMTLLEDAACV